LVKGGNYLEALAHTDTVVLDKTGTLTEGNFAVRWMRPAPGVTKAELLETAALAESYSNHPISKSLREALPAAPDPRRVADAKECAGRWCEATGDGVPVIPGNAKLMQDAGISFVPNDGVGTTVYVARGGAFLGSIVISAYLKPSACAAIDAPRA